MKLLELRLTAFGPFSGTVLDFRGGNEGLHLVYGPNEAGKSSALRALHQLFFGIPERSADNFRHAYSRLRIGGRLRGTDGGELDVVRRKGRSQTLRDAADDRPVDESRLQALLGGIDEALFRTLFALDHDELVQGGRQILEGRGGLGEMLFAAGAGIAGLRQVQQRLRSEADALFLVSGRNPRINANLAQLRQQRQELQASQLGAEQWTRLDDELRQALERKQQLEQELAQHTRRHQRLRRLQEARPLMLRRQQLLSELAPLAAVPLLPSDFGEQRRTLETDLAVVASQLEAARGRLAVAQQAAHALPACTAILNHAGAIEELHRESGSLRKAQRDREMLALKRQSLLQQATERLRAVRPELRLEQAELLRLPRAEVLRIQALGTRLERLASRLESSEEERQRLEIQVAALREQRSAEPQASDGLSVLRQVVARIQADGELEAALLKQRRQTDKLAADLARRLQRLPLWNGTAEALTALAVPAPETIERFEADFAQLERETQRLQIEANAQSEALHSVEGDLQRLEAEGHVPAEADLDRARAVRAAGWRLVRQSMRGEMPSSPEQEAFLRRFEAPDLLTAFEASLAAADAIADRLRREAQRVASKAGLTAERHRLRLALESLESQNAQVTIQRDRLHCQWQALWQPPLGIAPRSPREMRPWLLQQADLAARSDTLTEAHRQIAELEERLQTHRANLQPLLAQGAETPSDSCLESLLELARARIAAAEAQQARQRQLDEELARRGQELNAACQQLQTAREALVRARQEWGQALAPLGLPQEASAAQAAAVLDDLSQLFALLAEIETLDKRMAGIDRDRWTFAERLAELTAAVAPQLAAAPAEQAALQLNALLGTSREADARQKELGAQERQYRRQIEEAENRQAELAVRLQRLCEEAGCTTAAELPQVEAQSQLRQRLSQELQPLEQHLRELAQSETLEALLTAAQQARPEQLAPELEAQREQIEALSGEKSNLDQRIGHVRAELARMAGGSRAAALEQEIQELLGRLQADSQRWMRLRLAGELLRSAVERYRQHHQGPLLARASALFAQLTDGAFEALQPDLDEKGQPVLMGVRRSGERLGVAGMSEGTADQLYLALRLAGLEHWLERSERLPLVVDDVLVSFDDRRARAAIGVLARLARRTQVIFFTHHRHLVEIAKAHLQPNDVHLHRLEAEELPG